MFAAQRVMGWPPAAQACAWSARPAVGLQADSRPDFLRSSFQEGRHSRRRRSITPDPHHGLGVWRCSTSWQYRIRRTCPMTPSYLREEIAKAASKPISPGCDTPWPKQCRRCSGQYLSGRPMPRNRPCQHAHKTPGSPLTRGTCRTARQLPVPDNGRGYRPLHSW